MDYFINIDSICDVDKTQIREGYDNGVIADLSLMFADGNEYPDELPPMTVTQKPGDDFHYWLVDGHHRYKAAKNTGVTKLKVKILDEGEVNDLDDLRFLQAAENAEAVANRTVETRRRQVKAAIKTKPDWNISQLAKYCHVSHDLVNSVFSEMEESNEAKRPMKPIEKAAEAISKPENAGKSDRQIARETGLSAGTIKRAKENANSKPKNRSLEELRSMAQERAEKTGALPVVTAKELCEAEPETAIDEQLEKVASKAREKLKAPEADSIPIQDRNNIDLIVTDVLNWLGDRADVFTVLLRDRIENGN